jgi:drug/metabolite transporter (DMT)-like permease
VSHTPVLSPAARRAESRAVGLAALVIVILCFSAGSTLVKLSHTPGVTVAFWRMILCSVIWIGILRVTEGRWLAWSDLRPAIVPGLAFGLNIAFFFTGVTKTSVASAEFTGSLTPLLVVPLGAFFYREHLRLGALAFGGISLVGLALVLFEGPADGGFSWHGIAWVGAANLLWATYLLTSRNLRRGRSVAAVMAAITPIAVVVILPLALIVFPGQLGQVTGRSVVFIIVLGLLTGTAAHGLMVFAQQSVPIGVISMLQVSQPALATLWSVWFLSSTINGIQVVGMALVLIGLATVTVQTRRGTPVAE